MKKDLWCARQGSNNLGGTTPRFGYRSRPARSGHAYPGVVWLTPNGPMEDGNPRTGPEQRASKRPMSDGYVNLTRKQIEAMSLDEYVEWLRPCAAATDFGSLPDDSLQRAGEIYSAHVVQFLGEDKPWGRMGKAAIQLFRPGRHCVYFIGGDEGPIKIGLSNGPLERLAQFQVGSPVRLRIHALADGGLALERDYHRRFAAHRLHGEWFSPAPEILAEIDRLCAQQPEDQ